MPADPLTEKGAEMLPQPPFDGDVVLYCPVHGDRYLRTSRNTEPFPEPAACGFPLGHGRCCNRACTPEAPDAR